MLFKPVNQDQNQASQDMDEEEEEDHMPMLWRQDPTAQQLTDYEHAYDQWRRRQQRKRSEEWVVLVNRSGQRRPRTGTAGNSRSEPSDWRR